MVKKLILITIFLLSANLPMLSQELTIDCLKVTDGYKADYWVKFVIGEKKYFSIEYGPSGYPAATCAAFGEIKDLIVEEDYNIITIDCRNNPFYNKSLILGPRDEHIAVLVIKFFDDDTISAFAMKMETMYKIYNFLKTQGIIK